jgi:citrate lyase beta subunit
VPTILPPWLTSANLEFARAYPGESGRRQPVHTVYGGAHLFKAETCQRLGNLARQSLADYAPDAAALALAVGIPKSVADSVYLRVIEKLDREAVEDFRVDFEDGFGIRPDSEEDAAAVRAAEESARAFQAATLPPFFGFRVKPLNEELKERSVRTLDLFLDTLLSRTGGRLPENFVVNLPKISIPEQISAFVDALEAYGDIRIEIMVETPQAVLNLPTLLEAARGRCVAAHLGAYDYISSVGITSAGQDLRHPACDFVRSMMQASFGGTGVRLSDGATNILPIPAHRGESLAGPQAAANRALVHNAWKVHYTNVRHALANGFYQGWDLHPAQLPARYAAVYSFFLEGLDAASERLRNFIDKAAQATMVGDVFDDAATGQGLLNYFLRAINCGAIPASEGPNLTGLTLEELRSASFVRILSGRRSAELV